MAVTTSRRPTILFTSSQGFAVTIRTMPRHTPPTGNRVVHAHIKGLIPDCLDPDAPVFLGGGSRPNARFRMLCELASVKPKTDVENGEEIPWVLKDLRKTSATFYDEHVPESSIEILGHSVGGITYRHYAHRAPLAFKAITTLPL